MGHSTRIFLVFILAAIVAWCVNEVQGATGQAKAEGAPTARLQELFETEVDAVKANPQSHIRSLFVRPERGGPIRITMLVVHHQDISEKVRAILGRKVTPLVFSVSTLPLTSADFEPQALRFGQDGKSWRPRQSAKKAEMFSLGSKVPFGGSIDDSKPHQGVVLLPSWFDVTKPITVRYKSFEKALAF